MLVTYVYFIQNSYLLAVCRTNYRSAPMIYLQHHRDGITFIYVSCIYKKHAFDEMFRLTPTSPDSDPVSFITSIWILRFLNMSGESIYLWITFLTGIPILGWINWVWYRDGHCCVVWSPVVSNYSAGGGRRAGAAPPIAARHRLH